MIKLEPIHAERDGRQRFVLTSDEPVRVEVSLLRRKGAAIIAHVFSLVRKDEVEIGRFDVTSDNLSNTVTWEESLTVDKAEAVKRFVAFLREKPDATEEERHDARDEIAMDLVPTLHDDVLWNEYNDLMAVMLAAEGTMLGGIRINDVVTFERDGRPGAGMGIVVGFLRAGVGAGVLRNEDRVEIREHVGALCIREPKKVEVIGTFAPLSEAK